MTNKIKPVTPVIAIRYYNDLQRQHIFRVPHGMGNQKMTRVAVNGDGNEEEVNEFTLLMEHARSAMELGSPATEEEYWRYVKK